MNSIITISREFGSGGRELGKRLADELGFAYYDREIITALAEETGLNPDYPAIHHATAELLGKQHRLIQELAAKGDCVIVGRAADIVLEESHPFNVFVYADMESKLVRCKKRAAVDEHLTDKDLIRKIRELDRARAEHHDLLSSTPWGKKECYHLCVNTTGKEIKKIVSGVASYYYAWKQS